MTSTRYREARTAEAPNAVVVARTCAAEWTRLWTVRASWWFLTAAAVTMLGIGTVLGIEVSNDGTGEAESAAWLAGSITAMPAQFALLALALLAVTADYATSGIIPALQWTPRRGALFLARVLVPVVAATTIGVLLAIGSSLAAWAASGQRLALPYHEGAASIGWIALVFAAGASMAVGLGFLLRNTAGGLISVFLLMLVLPLLLPVLGFNWGVTLGQYLPGTGAINLLLGEDMGITRTWAVAVLLAWAAGALALGGLRFLCADADR